MVGNIETLVATASFALFVVWAWGMFSFRVPDAYIIPVMFVVVLPGWIAYVPGILSAIGIIAAFYYMM